MYTTKPKSYLNSQRNIKLNVNPINAYINDLMTIDWETPPPTISWEYMLFIDLPEG